MTCDNLRILGEEKFDIFAVIGFAIMMQKVESAIGWIYFIHLTLVKELAFTLSE
uniref:Uncharacterized protein n=1 Tax=Nelumbo nucifera TaxID=4432 RepID=A0A822Y4U2_NELNU|nr:TPA_asm: hypothetical protein HUJ06_027714 [Nelumbo nucifera]